MRTICKINGNRLYVDEKLGDRIKVVTPNYNVYRELNMSFMPTDDGWYEKWVDLSDIDSIVS